MIMENDPPRRLSRTSAVDRSSNRPPRSCVKVRGRPIPKENGVARVHCPDCDMSVVVDPTGMCPEGHIVAAAGQRGAPSLTHRTSHIATSHRHVAPDAVASEAVVPGVATPDGGDEDSDVLREISALGEIEAMLKIG